MGLDCNVIPQIKVGDEYVDSKCFKDLWDRAKKLYPFDASKARAVARADYETLKSTAFTSENGDWILLRAIQNSKLTDAQFATFQSIYGNNIDRLIKSITVPLNEQGEPEISQLWNTNIAKKSEILYEDDYPFIADSEQMYLNRIFAAIAFRSESEFKNLNYKDFKNGIKIRDIIAKAILQYASNANPDLGYLGYSVQLKNYRNRRSKELKDEDKNVAEIKAIVQDEAIYKELKSKADNLIALANQLQNLDDKNIWQSFVNYYKAEFMADINDYDIEDHMTMGELNGATMTDEQNINKSWNSSLQFKVNRKDTASSRFKRMLTEMIYNNQSNLMMRIEDTQLNGTASYYNKYGLTMPFDINVLWNSLIDVTRYAANKEELINSLKVTSESVYNGQLKPLIDKLEILPNDNASTIESKEIFYNMYMASVDMATTVVTQSETMSYNMSETDYNMSYAVRESNRQSFAITNVYNQYRNILTNKFQRISTRSAVQFDINALYKTGKSITDKVNNLLYKSNNAGINWTPNTIFNYLSIKFNVPFDVIKALYVDGNADNKVNTLIHQKIETELVYIDDVFDKIFNQIKANITDKQSERAKDRQANKIRNLFYDTYKSGDTINSIVDDMRGRINILATIGSCDPSIKVDLSYINVEGEQEYTPEFYNHITYMLQGIVNRIGNVNVELMKYRFADFLKSKGTKYNPIIWNLGNGTGGNGKGFFNFKKDDRGNEVLDEDGYRILDPINPVNVEAVKAFEYSRFNGLSNRDQGIGTPYVDMHDYIWTRDVILRQMQERYSLPSADASRIYEFVTGNILTESNSGKRALPFKLIDNNGTFVNYRIARTNDLESNYTFQRVKDTLRTEMEMMLDARRMLFDYDSTTHKLTLKKEFTRSKDEVHEEFNNMNPNERAEIVHNKFNGDINLAFEDYYNHYSFNKEVFEGLQAPIFWDGKDVIKNGKPTGNIFKFGNLNFRYTDENGNVSVRSIIDYIEDAFKELHPDELASFGKFEPFMICGEDFSTAYGDVIDNAFMRMFVDRMNSHLQDAFDYLAPIRDNIQSTLTYKNQLKVISEQLPDDYKNDRYWGFVVANLLTNHYIADIAIQELFTGYTFEFKNALDWAKRASQGVRPGSKTRSNTTYTQIIVSDVKLRDNMIDKIVAPFVKSDETTTNTLRRRFGIDKITTADAFNIITQDECIARFKAMGSYDSFTLPSGKTLKDIVEDEDSPISSQDYARIVEQLKYYFYKRGKSTLNNRFNTDIVFSHQDKNSTLVVFKRMYKGTNYETLYDWMKQEGIDSINFASGHKVGGLPQVKLFNIANNEQDAILNIQYNESTNRYELKNYPKGIDAFKHTLSHSNLYVQQEVPSHLMDEENKIGTQLQKRILDNLVFNGEYFIAGTVRKGKTGDKSFDKAGVFEYYQMLLATNANDEMYRLLSDWGAIDNEGNIKYKSINDKNVVEVDLDLVLTDLRRYFNETEIDRNFIKATMMVDGRPFISFYHPTIKSRIESVLLARITRRVTNLKLKGAHVTIQPDTFLQPASVTLDKKGLIKGTQANVSRMYHEGQIKFSDDYWKLRAELNDDGSIKRDANGTPIIKKDADFKLQSEWWEEVKQEDGSVKQVFHPAEIILNNWDSRFKLDADGNLDLNTVPENLRTMFGIRIPTEGHQSMFVAKVVGVLNNGASQAIVPEHLVTRTGWDYDIDSIYLSMKEFDVIDGNYIEYTKNNTNAYKRQSLEYVADVYFAKAKDSLKQDYLKVKVPLINQLGDINEKINTQTGINDPILTRLKAEYTDLQRERFYSKNTSEREALAKAMEAKEVEIESYNTANLNPVITDSELKALYDEKTEIYSKLKEAKKDYDAKYKEFIDKIVTGKWNELNDYGRMPRAAKDNAIIDTWIGIHSDLKNTLNKEKPNEFEHSKSAASYINRIAGYDNSMMNQHFLIDQIKIRNINNNIAVLKGQSIAADNALSIMGFTETKLSDDFAIPIRLNFSDITGYSEDIPNKAEWAKKQILKAFKEEKLSNGERSIEINVDDSTITVWCRSLYNNDYGTWTDINNEPISAQRSELTSHILDAVKDNLWFNLNTYTVGNTALLASFPISWNVNLKTKNAKVEGVNRYIYSALIESQQIISDFITNISIKSIENSNNFTNISFHNVRSDYMIDAATVMSKLLINTGESLKDFIKDYFAFNQDNVGLKAVINKINKFLAQEDLSNFTIAKAHKHGLTINQNQVQAMARFIEAIAEKTSITSYEINSGIKNKAKTITELDALFKEGQNYKHNVEDLEVYANYLNRQLEVLDYYMYVDKAVNAMKRAQGCLITEKKGAGPKTSESNKLFESIAMLQHNVNTLVQNAKDAKVPDTMIDELLYKYYSVNAITDKGKVIDDWIDKANDYLLSITDIEDKPIQLSKPKSPFRIGNQSMIEAIFPSITNPDWTIEDSAYPILQQQLYSTNEMSVNMFHDIFISENPLFKDKINYCMAKLGQNNNPELREALINYAIIDKIRDMSFFNDNSKSPETVLEDRAKLLGCTRIIKNDKNEFRFQLITDLSLTSVNLKTWYNETENRPYTHAEKIAMFKDLPVGIQLAMVKNTLTDGKYVVINGQYITKGNLKLNPNHILSLLSSNTMESIIIKNGYIGISTKESDDVDFTRDTFFQLINSPDEYCRILGENLVKYAFWINKLDFGRNLSKYIPIDLYGRFKTKNDGYISAYKTTWGDQFDSINFESIDDTSDKDIRLAMREQGIIDGGSNFRSNNAALYNYANALYASQSNEDNILLRDNEELDRFIEAFVRANSENTRIVKYMKPEYIYDTNSGKQRIKDQTPTFTRITKSNLSRNAFGLKGGVANEWHNDVDPEVRQYIEDALNSILKNAIIVKHNDIWNIVGQMIVEPTIFVNNSRYANDMYLKTREKVIDKELTGLKKSYKAKLPEGTLYKRFDINDCTFYYPINKTFKSEYLTTANDYFKYNIEAQEIYEKIATVLSKFYRKFNSSVTNTESHGSLTQAIDAATSNADITIYIGNESDTNRGLIANDDVITISTQRIIEDSYNTETLPTNIKNLALIANGEPLSQLEQLKVQGQIFKGLESLIQRLNPTNISAIQADGINDIIVDYIGIKKNATTTVHTINSITPKFSMVLDTQFVADDNTGLGISNLEFINTLYEVEKTAIGNTKLLRDEMSIMGELNTDLEKLDARAKDEIAKLGRDMNSLPNYIDTFKYNARIFESVKDMINNIVIDLNTNSIADLWTKKTPADRKQWVTDLNKLSSLIKSQTYIEDLNPIDEASFENASQTIKDSIKDFNEALLNLKGLYAEIIPLKRKVIDASKIYFGIMMNQKSHNISFNTKFKYIQDKLVETGFESDDIGPYLVTEKDIQENIRTMLGDNLDLSTAIKWLDSAAQSGIPIIDTVLSQYELHSLNATEFALNKNKQTFALFKKYSNFYSEKSNGKPNIKFSQARSNDFRSKFINDNNAQLTTPFDIVKAAFDYAQAKASIYDKYIRERKVLEPALESDDFITVKNAQDALAKLEKAHIKRVKAAGKGIYSTMNVSIPAEYKGRLELKLEDVYDNPKNYFPNLTDTEAYYYTKLIERVYKSKIRKKFAQVNGIKLKVQGQTTNKVLLEIKVCRPEYRDGKFSKLTRNDIDMIVEMQELFAELNDVAMPNTVKGANFFPTFISASYRDVLKQAVGWHELQDDDYKNTLSGETQYYLKATALNRPEVRGRIKYDLYSITNVDTYNALIEKANNIAKHRNYHKPITSIRDIVEYNQTLSDKQMSELKNRMNYDPLNVTLNYINQLKRIKINRDFEPELNLLQTILSMPEFQAREYGVKSKNIINKVLSLYTKKTEVVTKKGKDTYAFERFKAFYDAFEGKNRINTLTDQLLNTLHTVNSKSLMWMNLTAALKNIGTGHINIVSEATGGEFTTKATLLKAHEMYVKALPSLWASLGEYTCDNLDAALMKLAGNIFEDHIEAGVDTKTNIVSLGMSKWDNIMFSPNTIGEHYLQFATFLSAMQTHRIVAGSIMNYDQFVFSLREKMFEQMVDADTFTRYKNYKTKQESLKGNNIEFVDYLSRFISYKANNFTKEWKNNYAKAYKEALKDAKKKFESNHTTLYDSFELKEGIASIKENSGITLEDFAKFLGKVKGVNHSLHGIYNTFDKSMLSGKMWGEVILQFRKWLRPNFIRYWGKRVGKIVFDERLESYRSGAYMDMINFILSNGKSVYRETIDKAIENGEDIDFATKAKAIFNGFCGLLYWFKDINFRYNTLPQAQKANIKRAMFNFTTLVGLSLVAASMYAASDDDDELDENLFFALACYTIYGVQTELYETSPWGLYSFYKRTMEAPIPFETSISNVLNLAYWTLIAPMIVDNEEMLYDRGTYKDEDKRWIAFKKTIPLFNQYNKMFYLPKNNTYYMQQNPILQMIVELNK